MGRSRGTGSQRFRLFMWIATALWLVGAIAAVIDRDTLNAVALVRLRRVRSPDRKR